MALLREHAPDWQPELVHAPDGYILHQAPVGGYLMIRFRNVDTVTPAVPQAIMDNRNAAIPLEKITARDITDTHRRGVCMAAAFTFGLPMSCGQNCRWSLAMPTANRIKKSRTLHPSCAASARA